MRLLSEGTLLGAHSALPDPLAGLEAEEGKGKEKMEKKGKGEEGKVRKEPQTKRLATALNWMDQMDQCV